MAICAVAITEIVSIRGHRYATQHFHLLFTFVVLCSGSGWVVSMGVLETFVRVVVCEGFKLTEIEYV